jgi:hypothetical protein
MLFDILMVLLLTKYFVRFVIIISQTAKSGSLILLLEPSGPVKACNEIALPFTLHLRWQFCCTNY